MSMKHFLVLKTKHCIYRTPRGLLCSRLAVLYHWLVFWRLLNSLSSPVPFLKPSPFQKNRNNVSCFKGGQWEWSGSWKNSRKKRQPGIKIFKFNKHRGSSSSPPSSPCQECQQPGNSVPVSPSRRRCSTSWTSSQSSHALDLIQWKRICVQKNIYELLGLAQRCNWIIFLNNWF